MDLSKLTLPIPGYDGYEADSEGHIWSTASNWRGYGRRQLKETVNQDGYFHVRLYRDGNRVCKVVHVLVCLAFHGPKPSGYEVRHLDDIKTNNIPSNLA